MNRETDYILRLPDVKRRTGLSRSTIYRKMADGTFPPHLKLGVKFSGWHESDINAWVADPMGWKPSGGDQ